ncbi:hypothetical protein AAMO2058_000681600 [Amorphochlora amoebiformis]
MGDSLRPINGENATVPDVRRLKNRALTKRVLREEFIRSTTEIDQPMIYLRNGINLWLQRNAYSAISLVKTVFNYSAFDLFCLVRLDTLVTDNIFQYTGINDIHRMRSMLFWSENIQLFGTIAIPCLLHLFIKGCITMYPADYGTFCGPSSYSCKGLSGNHILHFKTLQQFFWRDGKMFYPPVDFREEAKSAGIKRDAGRGWMYTLRERGGDVVSEYAKNFPANLWDLIPQHKANETKIHFNHRQEL